ncbi:hypothetical protein NLG97_g2621 [Lecanicillium saksenae]|uniref:Uncharacterized protein n=1 Tax=Lecanicillium saksenae TaxID=468837 RepID=A0ACC1R3Q3_9HYPO|nr:hypothetical protein NLG97_g2621 [Lecanicillium saksenae]
MVTVPQSRQSDLACQDSLPSVEDGKSQCQMGLVSLDWDDADAFSATHFLADSRPRNSGDNIRAVLSEDNDTPVNVHEGPYYPRLWSSSFSPLDPSLSHLDYSDEGGVNASADNSLQALQQQVIELNTEIVSATNHQLQPDSTPPSISSFSVNGAVEGTRGLLRITNSSLLTVSSVTRHDGPQDAAGIIDRGIMDMGGLTMMIFSCHQHLLSLFSVLCCSIEQTLESMAIEDRNLHSNRGYVLQAGAIPSVAQFTMVLQLLVHLVNRLDRVFVATRLSCQSVSVSSLEPTLADQQVGPSARISADITSAAQIILQTIPDIHVRIRQTILQLQDRLEKLDVF